MDENEWRMTAIPARFIFVDSRAAMFFPPMLFYLRPVTLVAFAVVLLFLYQLERRGYTVDVALRMLRLRVGSFGKSTCRIFREHDYWALRDSRS